MFSVLRSGSKAPIRIAPRAPLGCRQLSSNATDILRRSYLYVPSSSQKTLDKSLTTPSDVIIYDLEDSVSPAEKDNSRGRLKHFFETTADLPSVERTSVRVNDISTPHFAQDIAMVATSSSVQTLVLPKIHSAADLHYVSQTMQLSQSSSPRDFEIIASIESAKGLWNLGEIASWVSSSANMRIRALLFAAEDYCADTSIIRTPSRRELLFTRSQIVNAAKAFGLHAIDMVCTRYQDPEYLENECQDGRQLGFDGKQAIHPNQVATIHSTFLPTNEDIKRAVKIVKQMSDSSIGAFGLDSASGGSEMIDAPMLKQALSTLRKAKAGGLHIPEV